MVLRHWRGGELGAAQTLFQGMSGTLKGSFQDLDYLILQICHHYLVPHLAQLPLDASLLKRDIGGGGHSSMGPPDQVGGDKAADDATDTTKDTTDPLQGDVSVLNI